MYYIDPSPTGWALSRIINETTYCTVRLLYNSINDLTGGDPERGASVLPIYHTLSCSCPCCQLATLLRIHIHAHAHAAVALLHTVLQYSTALTERAAATAMAILRSTATHGIDCYSTEYGNTCIGHSHTQQRRMQYPRFGITQ